MDAILKTENLGVGYGRRTILQNINLEVAPGSLTALIGAKEAENPHCCALSREHRRQLPAQ